VKVNAWHWLRPLARNAVPPDGVYNHALLADHGAPAKQRSVALQATGFASDRKLTGI